MKTALPQAREKLTIQLERRDARSIVQSTSTDEVTPPGVNQISLLQHRPEHTYEHEIRLGKPLGFGGQPKGVEHSRLLKNGATAHALTPEERARGGHARAEKIRRRKELRE